MHTRRVVLEPELMVLEPETLIDAEMKFLNDCARAGRLPSINRENNNTYRHSAQVTPPSSLPAPR